MMNRGNMGKQISNAPKSKPKKVKKMAFGGTASMPMPGKPTIDGPGIRPMPMPMPGKPTIDGPGIRPMPTPMPGKPTIDGPGIRPMPTPMPVKPMPGGGRPVQVKPPGKPTPMPVKPMPGGGRPVQVKPPGAVKMLAKGGKIDGCCMKGHTKGAMR